MNDVKRPACIVEEKRLIAKHTSFVKIILVIKALTDICITESDKSFVSSFVHLYTNRLLSLLIVNRKLVCVRLENPLLEQRRHPVLVAVDECTK